MLQYPYDFHSPRVGFRPLRVLCRALASAALVLAVCPFAPGAAIANSDIWGPQAADEPVAGPLVEWDWREKGLAYVDLPLGLRAHFNASYSRNFYPSEDQAEPLLRDRGPDVRGARALHSRIALSRPLTKKIEFEIACGTRNYFAGQEPLEFERYTIGAMIRISP